jgi:hypothetical protein
VEKPTPPRRQAAERMRRGDGGERGRVGAIIVHGSGSERAREERCGRDAELMDECQCKKQWMG